LTLTGQLSGDAKQVTYVDIMGNGDPADDVAYFQLTIDGSDTEAANWTYEWGTLQNPPADLTSVAMSTRVDLVLAYRCEHRNNP
jgi:hypothetical protein